MPFKETPDSAFVAVFRQNVLGRRAEDVVGSLLTSRDWVMRRFVVINRYRVSLPK